MAKTQTEKSLKSNRRHTQILIGVALIILAAVFIFIALEQPRVSEHEMSSSNSYTYESTASAQKPNEIPADDTLQQTSSSAVSTPINLNTCTAEQLMTIKNVGEARANAIISYRDYIGGYTSVEQLKNISGIGDSVYASIAPYVTV